MHLFAKGSCLDPESKLIKANEEVYGYVDKIDDKAAVVHLSKSAKQDQDVNNLVDSIHWHHKAVANSKGQMDKADNHQFFLVFFAFFGWRTNRFAHVRSSAKCQAHF